MEQKLEEKCTQLSSFVYAEYARLRELERQDILEDGTAEAFLDAVLARITKAKDHA